MFNFRRGLFSVFLLGFLIVPVVSNAAGLIPCATDASNNRACTLCDLIVGIKGIVDFGLQMITIVAIVGIFSAGVMYIISVGDSGMMESAKKFLGVSVMGFALVFAGWLIVTVVMLVFSAKGDLGVIPNGGSWWKFTCSTVSSSGQLSDGSNVTKYKCRAGGVCQTASDGIYTSKEECENSATCKATCADYHLACSADKPCCDTTQECVANPDPSIKEKWCAKKVK